MQRPFKRGRPSDIIWGSPIAKTRHAVHSTCRMRMKGREGMKALGSRLANWRVIVPVLGLLFACGLLAAGSASASIPRDASAPHVSSAAGSVPPPGNHAPDGSCLQWRIVPSANFTNTYIVSNELQAVEVVAPDNVWAVGYHEAYPNEQTLVTHWDGNAWSLVPSPNLGSGRSKLYGIDALAADDIWAVGESENRSFIIHWDGIDWSVVPHPYSSVLWGVAAVGSNDVWAVGEITGRAMIQ